METVEINPNIEAINSTVEKIKYYLYLPAHIKGAAAALSNVKESVDYVINSPAHVVDGSITAIRGRVNIPDIHKITRLYEITEPTLLLLTNP